MYWFAAGTEPVQHLRIQFGERVTGIHHQHQTIQGRAVHQIAGQYLLPMQFEALRHFGIAITGQVDQITLMPQGKKVDQLCAAWLFTHESQAIMVGKRVQGTRFACIRPASKGISMPSGTGKSDK